MHVDFPLRIGTDGRTATVDDAAHVRDMIELLLFTQPGERVMRPDFGTGLLQQVFASNAPELAAALQLTVQAGLTQYLGDVLRVVDLRVEAVEAELRVTLAYALAASGERRVETFVQAAP